MRRIVLKKMENIILFIVWQMVQGIAESENPLGPFKRQESLRMLTVIEFQALW